MSIIDVELVDRIEIWFLNIFFPNVPIVMIIHRFFRRVSLGDITANVPSNPLIHVVTVDAFVAFVIMREVVTEVVWGDVSFERCVGRPLALFFSPIGNYVPDVV